MRKRLICIFAQCNLSFSVQCNVSLHHLQISITPHSGGQAATDPDKKRFADENSVSFLGSLWMCKVLNEINGSASTRNHLEGPAKTKSSVANKLRKVQSTSDKIFVLVNEACTDNPSEKLDFSMRKEMDVICDIGVRVSGSTFHEGRSFL